MGEREYRKAVLPFLQAAEEAVDPSPVEPYAAVVAAVGFVVVVVEVGLDLDLGLDRAFVRVAVAAACAD